MFYVFVNTHTHTNRDKIATIVECLMLLPLVHCQANMNGEMESTVNREIFPIEIHNKIKEKKQLKCTLSVLPHGKMVGASMSRTEKTSPNISLFVCMEKPNAFRLLFSPANLYVGLCVPRW